MASPIQTQLSGGGSLLQTPTGFSPQGFQRLEQLLSQGGKNIQADSSFAPIENQANQQFYQDVVPSIAERFTAMGGGQRSSAFQSALGQAGSGLQTNLAALRSEHGFRQQQLGNQQLQLGLQPQMENHLQASPYQGLLQGLGASAPQLAELGIKGANYLMGGQGNQQQALGGQGGQGNTQQQGSNLANTLGTGASIAGGIGGAGALASQLGSFGTAAGGALTAAAPFALPVLAGAAGVAGLAYLFSQLLKD